MSNSIEGLILILVVAALVAAFMLFIRHDASYAHGNAFGRHLNSARYGWGGMIHKPGIPESRQT